MQEAITQNLMINGLGGLSFGGIASAPFVLLVLTPMLSFQFTDSKKKYVLQINGHAGSKPMIFALLTCHSNQLS